MVPGAEEHDLVPAGPRHRRFRAIALFQFTGIPWPATAIMILAIANGLLTSIANGLLTSIALGRSSWSGRWISGLRSGRR